MRDLETWLRALSLPDTLAVRASTRAARFVLPAWEHVRPGDERPRRAIEAAEAYLLDPCPASAQAAETAADEARRAAEAVEDARGEDDEGAAAAARVAAETAGLAAQVGWCFDEAVEDEVEPEAPSLPHLRAVVGAAMEAVERSASLGGDVAGQAEQLLRRAVGDGLQLRRALFGRLRAAVGGLVGSARRVS